MRKNLFVTMLTVVMLLAFSVGVSAQSVPDMLDAEGTAAVEDVSALGEDSYPDYMSFTAVGGSVTIEMSFGYGTPQDFTLEYATSKSGPWSTFAIGGTTKTANSVTLVAGKTMYLRNTLGGDSAITKLNNSENNYAKFTMSGDGTVKADGNIMSLLDNTCTLTEVGTYAFRDMFWGCTSLTSAPELPATTLAYGCYAAMFHGCTGLTSAPELPATTLARSCYAGMFYGCTGLTSAPELPATTLAYGCYCNMFGGCTNLNSISVSFTDWNEEDHCTFGWLYGVASTGTFTCPSALDTTTRGTSTVPEGWTIEATPYDLQYKAKGTGKATFNQSIDTLVTSTSSSTYNPELSYMLSVLANSAYNSTESTLDSEQGKHILNNLNTLGFSETDQGNYYYDAYNDNYPANSVAYTFGKKQLADGRNLVTIVLRGSYSGPEGVTLKTLATAPDWLSNYNILINSSGYHNGFMTAADYVNTQLQTFLGSIDTTNTVYVVTGHSRGAAVGNDLEILLSQEGVSQSDIYGYNFACPDTVFTLSKNGIRNNGNSYTNIFNINLFNDPVSLIAGVLGDRIYHGILPLTYDRNWGKYGQSYWVYDATKMSDQKNFDLHHQNLYVDVMSLNKSVSQMYGRGTMISANIDVKLRLVELHCPVDAEVTENGTTIMEIENNELTLCDNSKGFVYIYDDEKYIVLYDDVDAEVNLTGTADGSMNFSVSDVNLTEETVTNEKSFENVALTDGKTMTCEVSENTDNQDVSLYVTDDTGVKVKEIATDGTETDYEESLPFTDVPTDAYYYNPVKWAVANGVTQGTSDTTFSPNQTCTRGQVVTFLYRAAGEPAVSGTNTFVDVKASDYYYDAVLWAAQNGITSGTDATHFSPNQGCTRGQVVTFLWRTAGETPVTGANLFSDVKSGEYYYDAVLWAVSKGVTSGTSETTFSPVDTCTRAQIVTFLYRYFN